MTNAQDVIDDLTADSEDFHALFAGLGLEGWAAETPAPGWTVKHQVAHLTFVFRIAGLAAGDPAAFGRIAEAAGETGFDKAVNAALADYLDDPAEVLAGRWRAERDTAVKALAAVPADRTVPWLVAPLPPAVLAAAGMMELFAHGQDIADALGVERTHTDRLRPVAEFAVRTKDFGYQARGLTPPPDEFRFEITAPSGALWTFGPEGAAQRITGPAVDFCLLVTRRRHPADLAVGAEGAEASRWLEIAQAYRGPAGEGRRAGQFTR
ncbi:TIGR03084 family protein [Amycolatopsis rubida]|uniref:TIGR03084 family protein n=1 Tax=Amycolatopsis rubida TaxID=112413 RepID=A0ABX0C111_9PSEU|nr:TIGR03084 family metal-binding protein [Amycolatopsis sp. M39]MYW94158.1 TIGR03084 family protein [Amycolatopsis rubida]NEC59147.1 TIGR03084 family protein [Amycolatopsis rubida]OAP20927.1 hypothetical protein A4R44_08373 [Amycolatopsis sp. M39]